MFCRRIIPIALTVVIILTGVVIAQVPAQPKLDELRKQLDAIADGAQFKLGYSLHHLKTKERLDRLGDEKFPSDSTLKVAIMCAAIEKAERGEIGYYDVRPLLKEDRNAGGFFYLKPPKNTPSIAEGLDGHEFGIVGASPTINCLARRRLI